MTNFSCMFWSLFAMILGRVFVGFVSDLYLQILQLHKLWNSYH